LASAKVRNSSDALGPFSCPAPLDLKSSFWGVWVTHSAERADGTRSAPALMGSYSRFLWEELKDFQGDLGLGRLQPLGRTRAVQLPRATLTIRV